MPDVTSPDGLPFPVVGDNVSPRIAITQLAAAVQTALSSVRTYDNPARVTDFYGTAANIGTVTPKEGDTYQESDGNKILWKRVGGLWVTNENGMYLIRPGSVTNGSIAADGTVTPTAGATSLSFNNVFSTRFRAYRVEFYSRHSAANGNIGARLRQAGADNSTGNYSWTTAEGQSTSIVFATFASQTSWTVSCPTSVQNQWGDFEIYNPAHVGSNYLKTYASNANGAIGGTQSQAHRGGYLGGADLTSFDGFTVFTTVGWESPSWFKVYGLA